MALTKLISVDDFRKMLDKVESERDRIVIRLLFGTGCRVEELVSTKLEDVDTVKTEIFVGRSSPPRPRSPTTITPSYSTGLPRSILARISLAGTIGRGSSAGAPKEGLARSRSSNDSSQM
jgi:hypothetical protein